MDKDIEVEVASVRGKNVRVRPVNPTSAPEELRKGMTFKAPGIEVGTKGTVSMSARLNDYLFTPIFLD